MAWTLLLLSALLLVSCGKAEKPRPGMVRDEALRAGRTAASFPAADEDYFRDMDGGAQLSPEEVRGRNTWIVWTGGNDRLWDQMNAISFGALDFLKTLSSHPKLKNSRDNRWEYLGLVNEPCFEKATGPDPQRFGLWLDKRRADCPPDPFENEQKYPGVKIGARGKNLPVGSYYGWASGIVGLRLFPNPDFDEAAAKKWDAKRYYEDRDYYNRSDLVKPYRVAMSCGFCHVGPIPTKPPADPNNPKWENLSASVGAQYFWIDRIFAWEYDKKNFVVQLLNTSRPGALDTSLISTDSINNPRTMNAIYHFAARMEQAKRFGQETISGGGLNNKQFNDYVKEGPLTEFFQAPSTVKTPRVLKDGSDSVGALGALNRVYLNIGLFSEEWLLHFNALAGGKPISPIKIADAEKNSAYWQATEAQTVDMAKFFLGHATAAHRLKDAPGGDEYLTKDGKQLARGKVVFAERCARCHSSKLPAPAVGVDPGGCGGPNYLECWNRYWASTKTDEFKQQMRAIVEADNFLENNFLSSELRVPVTLLEINACSPLATNAIGDNIWDNFSSQSYKELPSVGTVTVHHPYTGEPRPYVMPAGGRGYTRPASLVSVWSTAPFLQNNSVGKFDSSPSVKARTDSFKNSIEQMLWPERRDKDSLLGDKVPGLIDRTSRQSWVYIPTGYLPEPAQKLAGPMQRWFPWLFTPGGRLSWLVGDGGVEIGPIPTGTPINLLSNINMESESPDLGERVRYAKKLVDLLLKIKHDLKAVPKGASDDEARKVFANLVDPLLEVSKCPDFVVNRGHYFGTDRFKEEPALSDDDKLALIEFLKTF
jgi:cytochrome c2